MKYNIKMYNDCLIFDLEKHYTDKNVIAIQDGRFVSSETFRSDLESIKNKPTAPNHSSSDGDEYF